MSVIDPCPDRYYGRTRVPHGGSAVATEHGPRLDVLVPASLLVLLALGRGPLHAYGIMRQVEKDTGTLLGRASLEATLDRLEEADWVEVFDESGPEGLRTFRMTTAGRNALRSEIGRVQRLAALARERRIFP